MHLYFYARGIEHQIQMWKMFMQTQFFLFPRKNLETGKIEEIAVQGALRPTLFGAWEYVFPKEALPEVLSMMEITPTIFKEDLKKDIGLMMMRKALNCKPIPKSALKKAATISNTIKIEGYKRILYHCAVRGVIIHAIGIKDDDVGIMNKTINENGIEVDAPLGFEQEML